jgi:ribosomal protein S18 acetylase RimI-like enzyme
MQEYTMTQTNPPTAPRVTIVEAGVEHVDALAPLFDGYRQFYRQPSDVAGAHAYLAERLSRRESVVFLALTGADDAQLPAGFTQLYPLFSSTIMRRMWLLNDLFVAPQARRLGIGSALLEAARAFGERTGAVELMLETAVDNVAAQALYESLGWQRDTEYYTYHLALR